VQIIGVSFDEPGQNAKFKTADKFTYSLWSDVGRELALYYGAASDKDQFFADRVTVVLDPKGAWRLVYPTSAIGWNIASHPQHVLQDCQALVLEP
jgi:peroxiredoxin